MTIQTNHTGARKREPFWPDEVEPGSWRGRTFTGHRTINGHVYREVFVVIETGEIVIPGDHRWVW